LAPRCGVGATQATIDVHKAISLAMPGDIVVMNTQGM